MLVKQVRKQKKEKQRIPVYDEESKIYFWQIEKCV